MSKFHSGPTLRMEGEEIKESVICGHHIYKELRGREQQVNGNSVESSQ